MITLFLNIIKLNFDKQRFLRAFLDFANKPLNHSFATLI